MVENITSVEFDVTNWHFERGIRVRGKENKSIFIPQNTDRFYEAKHFLQKLSKQAADSLGRR
jgi:hypothetical protein